MQGAQLPVLLAVYVLYLPAMLESVARRWVWSLSGALRKQGIGMRFA